MKTKLLTSLTFGLLTLFCNAQQNDIWREIGWLTGQWQGEGNGQPGQGGGTFSFAPDLDKKIIVRKSHSEYQSNQNSSVITHDDLMILYAEPGGSSIKAAYFDNEGHVINYSVTVRRQIDYLFERDSAKHTCFQAHL